MATKERFIEVMLEESLAYPQKPEVMALSSAVREELDSLNQETSPSLQPKIGSEHYVENIASLRAQLPNLGGDQRDLAINSIVSYKMGLLRYYGMSNKQIEKAVERFSVATQLMEMAYPSFRS